LAVLFASSLNGLTAHEALAAAAQRFTRGWPALIAWTQILLLNLGIVSHIRPVIRLQRACTVSCSPDEDWVALALRRLNSNYKFIIGWSTGLFVLGALAAAFADRAGGGGLAGLTDAAAAAGSPDGPGALAWFNRALSIGEAAVNGFFVGVVLSLQIDDRLFAIRETLVALGKREGFGYSSLFSKLFLILAAICLFLLMQAFFFAGSFFSLGVHKMGNLSLLADQILSGPDLLFQARQTVAVGKALDVFFLRLAVLSLFVAQMLYQMKRLIKRPLGTVLDRLEQLNSPSPPKLATIDIVQNDEFAAVYREINQLVTKKQAELECSGLRLENIVDSMADAIIVVDAAKRVQLANPAAGALFGRDSHGLAGEAVDDLFGRDVIAAHRDGSARLAWKGPDGRTVQLESRLSAVAESGWNLVLRDVSAQAEIEANLERAKAEAETASRMKSEFLANMSHELRTPLNAVLGFTQLLADDGNLTDDQRERIGVIARSGEHLLALINDILDISKIEAGKIELHDSVFDLPGFVEDLRAMFLLRCRKKGLSLYTDSLDGLPRYVRGDLGKLRQVLINLIGNAVKFTDEGGVALLIGLDADGRRIRFAVRDTGRGIPADELKLIVQPFVQASTTDHEGGTGLGLTISARYIELMGGKLEIESELAKGSTFAFALELPESAAAPESALEADFAIAVEPPFSRTALVVDDQATNRLVLKEMLERVGFRVAEADDGRSALAAVAAAPPDLVFMDIKMPVMDGYAAVAALKADPAAAPIPVFALTASAFSHDEKRILAAGFDGFLAKPFKQQELYRLIRERSGLDLRVTETAEASGPETAAPIDYAAAVRAFDPAAAAALADALAINDFAALSAAAAARRDEAPGFAAGLRAAAGAYDEAAVGALLEALAAARREVRS
jgi:PAS domain S-box-containing protein